MRKRLIDSAARHGQVRVVHGRLDRGLQFRVVAQRGGRRLARLAVRRLPRPEGVRVQGDQRGDVRLAVADHHGLADQGVAAQPVLQHGRGHVLAAGRDDDLLLPAGDGQVALVVQGPQVAGAEPAILGERFPGRLLGVPVAGEDGPTADPDLAVLADLDRHPGQRLAHAADLVALRAVHRHGRRRLRQPVALQHSDARAAEEVAQSAGQRGAPGDGVLRPAAQRRPQLAVDQPVEHRVLDPQAQPGGACGVLRLAVGDRHPGRPAEDRAPAVAGRLLLGAVVHLLEHPRHGQDEGGPEGGQRGQQLVDVRAVPEHHPGVDAAHLDDAGEHVRQRQEQQRAAVRRLGEAGQRAEEGVAHGGQQVLVGQLAALGAPGGA